MIWLSVCRKPPFGIPQIVLEPDDAAHLVCHHVVKWPIQGRGAPAGQTYGDVASAVAALVAAGYAGDAIAVADELVAALVS